WPVALTPQRLCASLASCDRPKALSFAACAAVASGFTPGTSAASARTCAMNCVCVKRSAPSQRESPRPRGPGAAGTWLWARSGRQGQEEGRPEGRPTSLKRSSLLPGPVELDALTQFHGVDVPA